jgi:hypothetical protein
MARTARLIILLILGFVVVSPIAALSAPGGSSDEMAGMVNPPPRSAARIRSYQLQINPNDVQVNKLAPIRTFRPFRLEEFRDSRTNAPIAPNSMVTLKNGKTVSGQVYVDQLNDLERKLNAYGYTMHDRRTQPLEIQRSKIDATKFRLQMSQLQELGAVARRNVLAPVFMSQIAGHELPALRKAHIERISRLARAIAQQPVATKLPDDFQPLDYPFHWGKDLGDSKYFQASIYANMDLNIQKDLAKASADAGAKVTVFGHDEKILDVSAGAQAPPKGSNQPMKVHFYVKVLDEDLFTPIDKQSQDPIKEEGDLKQDYPVEYKIPFMIGPIPVSLEFGFTASVGVKYGIYISPLYVDAKVTPFIHTNAYAKCGVDLIIVSAGVRFDLVLFNDDLDFGAQAGLATDKPDPYVHLLLYGKQNLTALAGKFKAYVSIDLFFWSDEWDWTIFDWDGFTYKDFLFTFGRDINLRTGEVTKVNVTQGVRVKIKHIAVDHKALKDAVKDKGYFAYALIWSGGQMHPDADRDVTDYYKNTRWNGQGLENLYPFPTWIMAKKVLTAPGRASVTVWVCYAKHKASNQAKESLGPDGKCGCGFLRLNPHNSANISFEYDFATKTFKYPATGNPLTAKAGDFITLKGADGEVDLTISEY